MCNLSCVPYDDYSATVLPKGIEVRLPALRHLMAQQLDAQTLRQHCSKTAVNERYCRYATVCTAIYDGKQTR